MTHLYIIALLGLGASIQASCATPLPLYHQDVFSSRFAMVEIDPDTDKLCLPLCETQAAASVDRAPHSYDGPQLINGAAAEAWVKNAPSVKYLQTMQPSAKPTAFSPPPK